MADRLVYCSCCVKRNENTSDDPAGESPESASAEAPESTAGASATNSGTKPMPGESAVSDSPDGVATGEDLDSSRRAGGESSSEVGSAADSDDIPDVDHLDPVGVVRPGDSDGLAALVVRSLGFGDGITYEGAAVEQVKRIQADNNLEPDGVVRGLVWCEVLPVGWSHAHGVPGQVYEALGGTDEQLVDEGGKMTRRLWREMWLNGFTEKL